MQIDIIEKLHLIQAHLEIVKMHAATLTPEDIQTAGGTKASEESLNYLNSQVDNALKVVANIL